MKVKRSVDTDQLLYPCTCARGKYSQDSDNFNYPKASNDYVNCVVSLFDYNEIWYYIGTVSHTKNSDSVLGISIDGAIKLH